MGPAAGSPSVEPVVTKDQEFEQLIKETNAKVERDVHGVALKHKTGKIARDGYGRAL